MGKVRDHATATFRGPQHGMAAAGLVMKAGHSGWTGGMRESKTHRILGMPGGSVS